MDMFDALAGSDLHSLDPSGGVIVVTAYCDHDQEIPIQSSQERSSPS